MRRPTKDSTRQEIFEYVVTKVIKQGALGHDGHDCVFLSGDGLKCAVGQLIPRAKYKPEFEGEYIDFISYFKDWSSSQRQFLTDLQGCHDRNWRSNIFVKLFAVDAKILGKRKGLRIGFINDLLKARSA